MRPLLEWGISPFSELSLSSLGIAVYLLGVLYSGIRLEVTAELYLAIDERNGFKGVVSLGGRASRGEVDLLLELLMDNERRRGVR